MNSPDYLSEKAYQYTSGQIGTYTKGLFPILKEVHNDQIKDQFEGAIRRTYLRHGKIPPPNFEKVIKDETLGANEKIALSLYRQGDTSQVKLNVGDYITSGVEDGADYVANHPVQTLVQAGTIAGLFYTPLHVYVKLIGAGGILVLSRLLAPKVAESNGLNYKA